MMRSSSSRGATGIWLWLLLLLVFPLSFFVEAFVVSLSPLLRQSLYAANNDNNEEESLWNDFEDLGWTPANKEQQQPQPLNVDLEQLLRQAQTKQQQQKVGVDYTAICLRQLELGTDFILSNYVGTMGFDKVTDWDYKDPESGQSVTPNPLDPSQPRRTKVRSESVIRLFRGELVGSLGGALRAQGLDNRILIKEFSGDTALELARTELEIVARLQSTLIEEQDAGEWIQVASTRQQSLRQDTRHVAELSKLVAKEPYVGILGTVNVKNLDLEPNEFYRALSVAPPNKNAVWIVYEYAGLSNMQTYSVPAALRRDQLPRKKGFFGNVVEPPPLPPFAERAKYVIGIIRKSIEALATLHERGLVHRSIGRTSVVLSSTTMDKRESVSPFSTNVANVRVKLTDFGFAVPYDTAAQDDDEFCARARTFGLTVGDSTTIATANFCMSEDLHALGFVVLGVLLTSLAELPNPLYQMPATDEDTLQRLLVEIFDKDFDQFRDYVEAEDIWSSLVALLDENHGAGWTVLETLMLAREKCVKNKDAEQMIAVRGLLSNPFFQQR